MSDEVDPKLNLAILGASRSFESLQTKLDTGMTVGQAINAASLWWNNIGRQLVNDQNNANDNPGKGRFTANPKTEAEAENSFPSMIMAGRPWDDLTKAEKLKVTQHWHHHHVRVPNIDPELYQRVTARPGKCFYCDENAACDETLPNGEIRELCFGHFMDRYPTEAEAHLNPKGANDG